MKGGEEDIVLCPSLMLPFFTLLFENSKISRLVDNEWRKHDSFSINNTTVRVVSSTVVNNEGRRRRYRFVPFSHASLLYSFI